MASTACDSGPAEDASTLEAEQEQERMFWISTWKPLLTKIEAATDEMRSAWTDGTGLSPTGRCSWFIGDPLLDVCLRVDQSIEDQDNPCPTYNPGYQLVDSQRSVDLRLPNAEVNSVLFSEGEPGSGGLVCLQIYSSSDTAGATCHYENCLLNGGMSWVELAHDAVLDDAGPHLIDALEDAGVSAAGRPALSGALLDMHEVAVMNVLGEDL